MTLGRKHADALRWTLAKKEFEKVDDAEVCAGPRPVEGTDCTIKFC